MSKENLEQFMNQIAESEELQAKIGEEIDAEALIALGAECGCEFTAEELQESAELSDAELGTVAGGAGKDWFDFSDWSEKDLYIARVRARNFIANYKGGKLHLHYYKNFGALELCSVEEELPCGN